MTATAALRREVQRMPRASRAAMARAVRDPASVGLDGITAGKFVSGSGDHWCGCPTVALALALGLVMLDDIKAHGGFTAALADAAPPEALDCALGATRCERWLPGCFDHLAAEVGTGEAVRVLLDLLEPPKEVADVRG